HADGFAGEVVIGLDAADSSVAGAHKDGVRDAVLIAVGDAGEHRGIADAGGGENDVLAGGHHFDVPDFLEVGFGAQVVGEKLLAFLVVLRPHTAELLAAEAFDGGGGDNGFGAATDADVGVDARLGEAGGDGGGYVAVADQ